MVFGLFLWVDRFGAGCRFGWLLVALWILCLGGWRCLRVWCVCWVGLDIWQCAGGFFALVCSRFGLDLWLVIWCGLVACDLFGLSCRFVLIVLV